GLSPSVRRLVKQYGLDPRAIPGTGPDGRIRVADVMAVLGGRAVASAEDERAADPAEARNTVRFGTDPIPRPSTLAPITTVFECNMTAALTHRKQMLSGKAELLLTSYYLLACVKALQAVPEANGGAPEINIAVALAGNEGRTVTPVIYHADTLDLAGINDTLREAHQRLRAGHLGMEEQRGASFVLYHHGLTGSLLAAPTPLGENHSAS